MFSEDSGVFRRVFHSNTGPLTNILVLDIKSERVPFDEWLVKPVLHGHRCSILQLTSTENASFMSLNHPPEPPHPQLWYSAAKTRAQLWVSPNNHISPCLSLWKSPRIICTQSSYFSVMKSEARVHSGPISLTTLWLPESRAARPMNLPTVQWAGVLFSD